MTFRPHQVTETDELIWSDCTWASGVMFANAAAGANIHPPTRAEYEALRDASGDHTGGSGLDELIRGMKVRYHWGPSLGTHVWSALWAAARPGVGLVIQGHLSALNSHYNRWNTTRVAHAMYAQREDAKARFWLQNPLAPQTYPGEYIDASDMRAFFQALPGSRFVAVEIGSRAPKQYRIHIAHGARIRLYTLKGSCIETWDKPDEIWTPPASSAPVLAPVHRKTCDGKSSATTAYVTKGSFAGRHIRIGAAYGVTLEEV